MVVVVLITGAAAVALHLYGKASQWPAEEFEATLFSVRQQAGVVAALAAVVFAVLTALQHGKQGVSSAWTGGGGQYVQPKFGGHRGGPEAAAA